MSSKKLKIFKVFDENPQLFSTQKLSIDKNKVNDVLSQLYSPGESYQFIYDFSVRQFHYVSKSVYNILGERPETFNEESFLDRIHPEDLDHFLNCERISGHFLFNHINKETIPHYKVSYQMRMRDDTGNYKLILHQGIALVMDEKMSLVATLINHSDISHITNENNYKISFINIKGGQSYFDIDSITDLDVKVSKSVSLLSKREIEILRHLSEGLSTKDVAENLYISPDTVRTHRNNILKKTDFKNISEAVAYFIRNGLI